MKIIIKPEIEEGRCGIIARSANLGLCACGANEIEALEKLKSGIKIWSRNLNKEGILINALSRANLEWVNDNSIDDIEIDFVTLGI